MKNIKKRCSSCGWIHWKTYNGIELGQQSKDKNWICNTCATEFDIEMVKKVK